MNPEKTLVYSARVARVFLLLCLHDAFTLAWLAHLQTTFWRPFFLRYTHKMLYITVSLLGVSNSWSQSFRLEDYKTFESLHAAILTRFNILVDKGKICLMPSL